MKRLKGFTLVELSVTIIIVIVLMAISVPLYNVNTTKVKLAEGYALLAAIRSAQEQYFAEHGVFLLDDLSSANGGGWNGYTINEKVLGINARTNKYFTKFNINDRNRFCNADYSRTSIGFAAVVQSKTCGNLMMLYNITEGVTTKQV